MGKINVAHEQWGIFLTMQEGADKTKMHIEAAAPTDTGQAIYLVFE